MSLSRPVSQDTYTFNKENIVLSGASTGRNSYAKAILNLGKSISLRNKRIALESFNCYYCFPSVSNDTTLFKYVWIDGITYTVPLKRNGTYSASDLNGLLQFTMRTNGHYLYNSSTGGYLYYLDIAANSVEYALQANSNPVPTALPSGYAIGTGSGTAWTMPVAARNPQFLFDNSDWYVLSGFSAGTYPTSQTPGVAYSLVGGAPHLSPTSNVSIRCSAVLSANSTPIDQIATIPINVAYGASLSFKPNQLLFYDCVPAEVSQIQITLCDDSERLLTVLDSYWSCTIIIRDEGSS